MKNPAILFLSILLIVAAACKKSSNSTPNNNNNNTSKASPYYFKGTFNGANMDLADSTPQYMSFYTNVAGGYEDTVNYVLFPSMGLSFTWHLGDTVKESDLMGLVGKTLYFNDTNITPELNYSKSLSSASWTSVDTASTNYYVKVTNIVFLKNDTTLGTPLKTYVITGTCAAMLNNGTTNMPLTNGSFNFIISRINY